MTGASIFCVYGRPEGQGNHRVARVGGFSRIYDANRGLKPWREAVAMSARAAGWDGETLLDGPIAVSIAFAYRRPDSHFAKAGGLRASAPWAPHQSGEDVDKLTRSVLDALTGVVWSNDRRVVKVSACRLWGTVEGALIQVEPFVVPYPEAALCSLQPDAAAAMFVREMWPRIGYCGASVAPRMVRARTREVCT